MRAVLKIIALALILGVLTAVNAVAHETESPVSQCPREMTTAAVAFAKTEFPPPETYMSTDSQYLPQYLIVSVPAHNDIFCQRPECMANVVIVAEPNNHKAFYDIFRIHLSADGALQSAVRDSKKWHNMTKPDGWKASWRDFVKSVYPHELKEQECK